MEVGNIKVAVNINKDGMKKDIDSLVKFVPICEKEFEKAFSGAKYDEFAAKIKNGENVSKEITETFFNAVGESIKKSLVTNNVSVMKAA